MLAAAPLTWRCRPLRSWGGLGRRRLRSWYRSCCRRLHSWFSPAGICYGYRLATQANYVHGWTVVASALLSELAASVTAPLVQSTSMPNAVPAGRLHRLLQLSGDCSTRDRLAGGCSFRRSGCARVAAVAAGTAAAAAVLATAALVGDLRFLATAPLADPVLYLIT